MFQNRIQAAREAAGLTIETLAGMIGMSTSALHRLQGAELVRPEVARIAAALDVAPEQLIGVETSGAAALHLTHSARRFDPPPGHALAGLRIAATERLWQIIGSDLEQVGIFDGDIVIGDTSPTATRHPATGDSVVIAARADGAAAPIVLARQFVAPGLYVTNRRHANPPPLSASEQHVDVLAIMRRRFGAIHAPPQG